MQDLTGKTWGRFQIVQTVGQGGMATVYKAFDSVLQRTVALKVLYPALASDQELVQRFRREAITAANLRHPNIVVIYDVGEHEGAQYIVMEYLAGTTLEQILQGGQPLPLSRIVSIVSQVANALDYAHGQSMVHRDVKPSNFIVDEARGDHTTLTDFGLVYAAAASKLSASGTLIGTPSYMAPEQAQGEMVDHRADIYALGIVLYQMLTGQQPFQGSTPYAILYAVIQQEPPRISEVNPGLPQAIDAVVAKALAKDPGQRYQSASDLARALEAAAAGKSLPAKTIGETLSQSQVPAKAIPRPERRPSGPLLALDRWWSGAKANLSALLPRPRAAQPAPPRAIQPEPRPMPEVPPSLVQRASPSLILRPHLHQLLDPLRENTIRELLSLQEPEKYIDSIAVYGRGRFIITGYGSFGGTTLAREIVDTVNREASQDPGAENLVAVWLSLVKSDEQGASFAASIRGQKLGIYPQRFATEAQGQGSQGHDLDTLLDALCELMAGEHKRSPLGKKIEQIIGQPEGSWRLAIVVDKAPDLRTLENLANHPLLELERMSCLAVAEREWYDRWDVTRRRHLQRQQRFQVWKVPCLWEADYHLVEQAMALLFRGYRLDSPEMEELRDAFDKHIAFVGRGGLGKTVRELQQLKYWQFDEQTKQPFVALEQLDRELILHNAWLQDTLEANWDEILGRNFPGRERTDRAKQGVYDLVDWIVNYATFTLEEALEQAAAIRVQISDGERLRNLVVVNLLKVLVDTGYLQQVEDAFDIVWGRDVAAGAVRLAAQATHAEEIAAREKQARALQTRLDALLADHEAANNQLSKALSEVDRIRLGRTIEDLDREIAQVEEKLASLRGERPSPE